MGNYDNDIIEWTDTEVSKKCSNVLYEFHDYAVYYAFSFVSFDITNLIKQGNYLELGEKGDDISSFVCFGNHNFCICFTNVETRNIVRQMTINYFMVTGIVIDEHLAETSIKIMLHDDYVKLTIPNKAMGTKLTHQKQMKENIVELLSNLNKVAKNR